MAAAAPLLVGCAAVGADGALDASTDFQDALRVRDGARACELLAPRARQTLRESAHAPCEQAVLDELEPARGGGEVHVYGTAAQVRFDGDVVFLSRFRDGWLVSAAGCTPRAADAYDCSVEVG